MRKFFPIALFALFVGCDFRVDNSNVPAKLASLERDFGVQWPTNCIKQYGASLSTSFGNYSEVAARLEVTNTTFFLWRQSATNKLKELQWFSVPTDPKLESRFPWWDCSKFPASRISAYMNDSRAGSGPAFLSVYVLETNGVYIMYIQGTKGGR
ncbi:MAG: hypothetical protein EXS35_02145 [Pedosphaera sp.]|nr:hypothetical protein [Pedosphaera sp.]